MKTQNASAGVCLAWIEQKSAAGICLAWIKQDNSEGVLQRPTVSLNLENLE
ncbi:MAG: hypothetical protein AAFP20_20030 [Cyanobacteria bacterium J06614_10]